MVDRKVIVDQLRKIGFNISGWGRTEVSELPHIILPDEEIYECVNGIYDGGFALLVATNVRVLLVDKKPLNYLTVEDMRFDMISEMDYSHRLLGATISISSGDKNLRFRSYNQARLRKLIGHVQHCMAESKKRIDTHQEGQVQHLEQINKQLQSYLIAQQQYQQQLQSNLVYTNNQQPTLPEPPKPSNELADYLYAQSLLSQYNDNLKNSNESQEKLQTEVSSPQDVKFNEEDNPTFISNDRDLMDIYDEGKNEIYSSQDNTQLSKGILNIPIFTIKPPKINVHIPLEIHPIQVALSKLPQILKSRKVAFRGDT